MPPLLITLYNTLFARQLARNKGCSCSFKRLFKCRQIVIDQLSLACEQRLELGSRQIVLLNLRLRRLRR